MDDKLAIPPNSSTRGVPQRQLYVPDESFDPEVQAAEAMQTSTPPSTFATTSDSMETDDDYPKPKSKDDPDYDFEVEALKSVDIDDIGALRFHVKWKGYPDSENTAETIDQLNGCHQLLKTTLLTRGHSAAFKVNASSYKVKKFNNAHYQSLLKGHENVEGSLKIEKSKKLIVMGEIQVEGEQKEFVVLFDNNNAACVPEKDLIDNYGPKASLAIDEFHCRLLYRY